MDRRTHAIERCKQKKICIYSFAKIVAKAKRSPQEVRRNCTSEITSYNGSRLLVFIKMENILGGKCAVSHSANPISFPFLFPFVLVGQILHNNDATPTIPKIGINVQTYSQFVHLSLHILVDLMPLST